MSNSKGCPAGLIKSLKEQDRKRQAEFVVMTTDSTFLLKKLDKCKTKREAEKLADSIHSSGKTPFVKTVRQFKQWVSKSRYFSKRETTLIQSFLSLC